MNFRLIITLLAFLVCQNAFAQIKKSKSRQMLEDDARSKIVLLKEGALLVRLDSRDNVLRVLRKEGKLETADELEKQQLAYNQQIIEAFRANFNFCPVYFCYSESTDAVLKKQMNKIVFLNDSLQADTTIHLQTKFLTAEITTIQADTATYLSNYTIEADEDWSAKRVQHYSGGPSMGFDALIIKTDQFRQLRDPFPYYVRTRSSRPKKKVLFEVVKKMDFKLNAYLLKKDS